MKNEKITSEKNAEMQIHAPEMYEALKNIREKLDYKAYLNNLLKIITENK